MEIITFVKDTQTHVYTAPIIHTSSSSYQCHLHQVSETHPTKSWNKVSICLFAPPALVILMPAKCWCLLVLFGVWWFPLVSGGFVLCLVVSFGVCRFRLGLVVSFGVWWFRLVSGGSFFSSGNLWRLVDDIEVRIYHLSITCLWWTWSWWGDEGQDPGQDPGDPGVE